MTGYTFTLTCGHCAALLDHTANGALHPRSASAVAHCGGCGSDYRVDVVVSVLNGPAIRDTLPQMDAACRNPNAAGAPLIDAMMAAAR